MEKMNLLVPKLDPKDVDFGIKLTGFLNMLKLYIETEPSKVKVGSFDCPGSIGDHSVTGIDFSPRYVEFRISATFTDRLQLGFGWMDYNGNQSYAYIAMLNDTERQNQATDNCIGVTDYGGNSQVVASYKSMNSNGFTITFSVVTAGNKIQYKAVR